MVCDMRVFEEYCMVFDIYIYIVFVEYGMVCDVTVWSMMCDMTVWSTIWCVI